MPYTLTQAAEATGKSKSTIFRAIKNGKLTAARDEVTQDWLVEPAELHRLYPPSSHETANGEMVTHHATGHEIATLRREVEVRDELLAKEQQEREAERRRAQETIDDLRRRLDAEGEERRKLTAIITDQRPIITSAPEAAAANDAMAPAKRRWRLWGRG